MRNVSTTLCLLVLAAMTGLFTASAASADGATTRSSQSTAAHRTGPAMIVQRIKAAVGQLDLTDEQKTKVAAILDQASQDADDLTQQLQSATPSERAQKVQTFAQDLRQKLAGVLTDEQIKALQDKMGLGAAKNSPAALLTFIRDAMAKLDLTADQQQQVKDLLDQTRTQLQDLRKNGTSGPEAQASIKKIRQDFMGQLKVILTPEQMQNLQQMIQDRQQNPQHEGATTKPTASVNDGGASAPAASDDKARQADLRQSGLAVDSTAPATPIAELNGHIIVPANNKGRVLVLEFGSLSCPTFRDKVKAMEELKSSEAAKAFFFGSLHA